MANHDLDQYCGTAKADQVGKRLVERLSRWRQAMKTSGLYRQWVNNWLMLHNQPPGSGVGDFADAFGIEGENDDILSIRINDMRSLHTQMLNLVFGKPPGLKAVAANASPEAMLAASVGDALLADDFSRRHGHRFMRKAGDWALAQGTSFVFVEWDQFAGQPFVPDGQGGFVATGGPRLRDFSVADVSFDRSKRDWEDVYDVIVCDRANRYVLASQYPDHADTIMQLPPLSECELSSLFLVDEDSDDVFVGKYLHRPVSSTFLPNGRYVMFLEDDTVIYDGENPYGDIEDGRIGLFPMTGYSPLGLVYAHASASDIAPVQRLKNLTATIIATKIAAFGAGTIVGPTLDGLDVQHLVGGLKYVPVSGNQLPEVLDLLQGMGDLFKVTQFASEQGNILSGLNSIRGDILQKQELSGKAIGLLYSMAVQSMSSFQRSVFDGYENSGNYMVGVRRKFTPGIQVANIVGENNVQQALEWTKATLTHIARVRCEAVDPAAQTAGWKEERATMMVDRGMIKTPWEYNMVLDTGRLEPLTKADQAQLFLIQRENKQLLNGEEPIVYEEDSHEQHVVEHNALTADPIVRQNSASVGPIKEHVAKHQLFLLGVSPIQGPGAPSALEQFEQAKATAAMQPQPLPVGPEGQPAAPGPQGPAPAPGAGMTGQPPQPDMVQGMA